MAMITCMDAEHLARQPSAQMRGLLAAKIAADFRSNHFTPGESAIAEEIFRLLARDAEAQIRARLAAELAHCDTAPRDVMLTLARDAEHDVALPVLEHSRVLTGEDLAEIIRSTHETVRLCAIARRGSLPQDLSRALLENADTLVLHTLFANTGAVLDETNLLPRWQDIPFTQPLLEALVRRGGLPLAIVEKLYHAVSGELRARLTRLYPAHSPAIARAARDAREWALLGIAPQEQTAGYDEDMAEDFIDDLYLRGRLTHSLLMRALCAGNLAVFEMGIARLADVPRVNARILLMEGSGRGLTAIYRASGMPEGFLDAVRTLLKISLEETGYGRVRHSDFSRRVIDRIYMGGYHRSVENMEYLLSIIGGRMAPAHVH